tara:strand:+ start:541 stop:1425 length:885 start_codon:yes stop_codon:yes gene_type:complete
MEKSALFQFLKRKAGYKENETRLRPSAICIGAQKGGTTALHNYISIHPRVIQPAEKEIDFFNCNERYSRGIDFYHSKFPLNTSENKITLDITPGYLGGAKRAAKRIFDYNEAIRLIVLLRDPTTRAYSAWQMYRKRCETTRDWFSDWMKICNPDIEEAHFIKRPDNFGLDFYEDMIFEIEVLNQAKQIEMPILSLGMYHQALKYYYDLFASEQILVISSEEFKENTPNEISKIETHIGLEPHHWNPNDLEPQFAGGYSDKISQKASQLLNSFYRPQNLALFDLLQTDFHWDSAA